MFGIHNWGFYNIKMNLIEILNDYSIAEKHKTYHIKDEQLARDGFKKFLKPDICGFPNCRFSQVCNHIHCVRDGCSYVLHSSGQLLSHKRKHERKDSEIAYRKFKLAQQAVVNLANNEHVSTFSNICYILHCYSSCCLWFCLEPQWK